MQNDILKHVVYSKQQIICCAVFLGWDAESSFAVKVKGLKIAKN